MNRERGTGRGGVSGIILISVGELLPISSRAIHVSFYLRWITKIEIERFRAGAPSAPPPALPPRC